MVVYSLISAVFTLIVLVFVGVRLAGRGEVPYFVPHRRVPITVPARGPADVVLAAPRSPGALRAALVRSRRRRP